MINSRLLGLPFIYFLLSVPVNINAQDETSIRTIIEAGDVKKLVKADEMTRDADLCIEEASRLNMEVFTVQADLDLDEKSITRKSSQLEKQAIQKQIEASGLYEKANEIKFAVYRKYLDAFWKSHEGEESSYINAKLLEEQASDNYFQAASYRIDARRLDDANTKAGKLTEADNLETEAIHKQLTALGIYYGIGEDQHVEEAVLPAETVSAPGDKETTLPGQLQINQEMIDMYNRYISAGQLTDTTLSTGYIAGVTEFETNNLLKLWYDYIYGHDIAGAEYAVAANKDTLQAVTENSVTEQAPDVGKKPMEIGIVTDENKDQIIPADEEIIYRIQIAANRTELSQRALGKMYYGNKRVEMINENGWYKYSVGDFGSYEDASAFRKASAIENAYIVAYRKGTRFEQGPALTEIKPPVAYTPEGEQRMPSGLVFRIQVAASRVPVTVGQLKRIYSGNYPVEMISEDNWYKFQLMGVRLYSDALQILKNIQVNGVFIVAYDDGIKVNPAEAVKRSRELEQEVQSRGRKGVINEIEYHVQIAASRNVIKQDELRSLYGGPEAISIIFEDGWYKYHIKAGNAPELAEQFKRECGIDKAFIVPYRRAVKITYYEAIQENK